MGDSRTGCGRYAALNEQLRSTQVISAGHAFVQNVRRGHYELGSDTDPKHRLTTAFAELTRAL